MKDSMLAFNALQIVILFACLPFIISWLWTATFAGASAVVWIAIITYVILFFMMIGNTFNSMVGDK